MPRRLEPIDPREWLNRAGSSLRHARSKVEGVYLEDLCFDAQQAAEKAIKAVLVFRRVRFPYVHDLETLLTSLSDAGEVVPESIWSVRKLTHQPSCRPSWCGVSLQDSRPNSAWPAASAPPPHPAAGRRTVNLLPLPGSLST